MNVFTKKLGIALAVCGALAACEEQAPKDPVLATVGSTQITQSRYDAYLKHKRVAKQDDKRAARLLDDYLEREALTAAIEKEGKLDNTQVEVEVQEFKKQLMISRYFDQFLDEKVTDQAVKNYYEAHKKDYAEKKVHVAHVLIRLNKRMSEEERKAKLTTAQEAYSKLQAGDDFAEVAKTLSEDKVSGRKGGDLGWIREGGIDPKFSQVAFKLEVGKVSEPFETPFGFHVIKVLEAPKVIEKPLRVVSGDIRHMLRAKAKKAELERLKGVVDIKRSDAAPKPSSKTDTKSKDDKSAESGPKQKPTDDESKKG